LNKLSCKGRLATNKNKGMYVNLLFNLIRKRIEIAIGIAAANESKNRRKQLIKK
tara:strand:- start:869 stop:1030 length:162 start_codon:yes stop_codon:yes gene_type:complete